MVSVAAVVWNGLAKEQKLRTEWARHLFLIRQEQIGEVTDAVAENLYKVAKQKLGVDDLSSGVTLGYLAVLPLLLEAPAIRRYLEVHPGYSNALPEVNTLDDAVNLMARDQMLQAEERSQLWKLLPKSREELWEVWEEPMRQAGLLPPGFVPKK